MGHDGVDVQLKAAIARENAFGAKYRLRLLGSRWETGRKDLLVDRHRVVFGGGSPHIDRQNTVSSWSLWDW